MEGRVPPHKTDAEIAVIGGLMLEQNAYDEVADLLAEDDFYLPAHRSIYRAIQELNRKGQPTDLITVSNILMKNGDLESIGGPKYLAEILDQTPSAANIGSYAQIIHEQSLLRRLIGVSGTFIERSYKQDFEELNVFLDQVESEVFSLAERKNVKGLVTADELVKSSISKLEQLSGNSDSITGVSAGFTELDNMTAGFQPGEMTIIAARPSMGKTAFSLNIALHAALKENKRVAYFSVEMAKEAVMTRMLAVEGRIQLGDLRVGSIDDKGWLKLINTAAKLSESHLFIDDTSGISPLEIRAKCRRMKAKYGLDMIMVDYLQLMTLKQKVDNREREVSEISRLLKAVAKELEVPVIALAQLNRGVEGRSDRRPMLSDLRESGSIEQDADIIMMLYRQDYYDRDDPEIKGIAEVIIGKQRNGPTGTVKLRWQPEFGIFRDHTEQHSGPTPPMPDAPPIGLVNKGDGGKPKNFAPGS